MKKRGWLLDFFRGGSKPGDRIPSCLPSSVANQFVMAFCRGSTGSGAPSSACGVSQLQARRLDMFYLFQLCGTLT